MPGYILETLDWCGVKFFLQSSLHFNFGGESSWPGWCWWTDTDDACWRCWCLRTCLSKLACWQKLFSQSGHWNEEAQEKGQAGQTKVPSPKVLHLAVIKRCHLEGLLLVVDVPDMSLQVGGDGEGPVTVLALVRLLPRVGPEVPGQVSRPRERLAAEPAPVPAGPGTAAAPRGCGDRGWSSCSGWGWYSAWGPWGRGFLARGRRPRGRQRVAADRLWFRFPRGTVPAIRCPESGLEKRPWKSLKPRKTAEFEP